MEVVCSYIVSHLRQKQTSTNGPVNMAYIVFVSRYIKFYHMLLCEPLWWCKMPPPTSSCPVSHPCVASLCIGIDIFDSRTCFLFSSIAVWWGWRPPISTRSVLMPGSHLQNERHKKKPTCLWTPWMVYLGQINAWLFISYWSILWISKYQCMLLYNR